jgi:hypothetical protein
VSSTAPIWFSPEETVLNRVGTTGNARTHACP